MEFLLDEEVEETKIAIMDTQPPRKISPPYNSNTISATKDMNYFDVKEPIRQQNNYINRLEVNKKYPSNSLHTVGYLQQQQLYAQAQKQESIQNFHFKTQNTYIPQTQQIKPFFGDTLLKLPTQLTDNSLNNAPKLLTSNTFWRCPESPNSPLDNFQAIKADFRPQIPLKVKNSLNPQQELPSSGKEQQQELSLNNPDNLFLQSAFMCEGKELKTCVICDMCTKLNLDPAVCENCGKSYCYPCFKKWVEEGTGCFKCGSKKYTKKTPPMYDDLLGIVKFDCPYSKNEMPFPICTKLAMPYKEAIEHIKTCNCAVKSCENSKCSFRGMLQDLEKHRQICEFKEIRCQYCKVIIDFKVLQQHQQEHCPEVTLECNLCTQQFLRKDIAQHEKACPMIKAKCSCGEEVFRKDYQTHINVCPNQEEQCKKCQRNHLRRDMGNNAVCIRALSQRCEMVEYQVQGIQQDIRDIHRFIESHQKKEKKKEIVYGSKANRSCESNNNKQKQSQQQQQQQQQEQQLIIQPKHTIHFTSKIEYK